MLICYICKNRDTSACYRCIGWDRYKSDTLINPALAMDIDKEMKMLAKVDLNSLKVDLNSLFGVKSVERKTDMRIKKVYFNDPATVVLWEDGTKTIVKAGKGDIYDPEKGLAMAIAKKALGNQGNYYEVFKKWLPEEEFEYLCERIKLRQAINKCFGCPEDSNKVLYSVSELAKKLGVSRSTISKKCREGKYPGAFKEDSRWIIPIADEECSDK